MGCVNILRGQGLAVVGREIIGTVCRTVIDQETTTFETAFVVKEECPFCIH